MDVSEPGADVDMELLEEPCKALLCEELFNPASFTPALCVLAARMRLTHGAW